MKAPTTFAMSRCLIGLGCLALFLFIGLGLGHHGPLQQFGAGSDWLGDWFHFLTKVFLQ